MHRLLTIFSTVSYVSCSMPIFESIMAPQTQYLGSRPVTQVQSAAPVTYEYIKAQPQIQYAESGAYSPQYAYREANPPPLPQEEPSPVIQNSLPAPIGPMAYEPPLSTNQDGSHKSIVERIFKLENPTDCDGRPVDVNNLNGCITRVGRELQFLCGKSREFLFEKVKSLAQLKRMREGLKQAYADIYSIQFCLSSYQKQLSEMRDYLSANKGRIVVIDNKQLNEMYSMVKRVQQAAEGMFAGLNKSKPESASK